MIQWMDSWEGALDRARSEKRDVHLFLHSPT